MAVPIGRLMVENFQVLAQDLDSGKCRLEPSDTCEMNSAHPCAVDPLEPVHRVLNPRDFNERAVSLHVYRSEEHTSELQSLRHLVCRLLLEKKKKKKNKQTRCIEYNTICNQKIKS